MSESPRGVQPSRDRRPSAVMGAAIGIGLATARGVQRNLEPSLGQGWAFVACVLAAGVAGGLVSLAASWLIKPRSQGHI